MLKPWMYTPLTQFMPRKFPLNCQQSLFQFWLFKLGRKVGGREGREGGGSEGERESGEERQSRKKQKGKQIHRGLLCYLSSQEKEAWWTNGGREWHFGEEIRKGLDFPFSSAIARRVLYSDKNNRSSAYFYQKVFSEQVIDRGKHGSGSSSWITSVGQVTTKHVWDSWDTHRQAFQVGQRLKLKNDYTAWGQPGSYNVFFWGLARVLNFSLLSLDSNRWLEKFIQYTFQFMINYYMTIFFTITGKKSRKLRICCLSSLGASKQNYC